MSSTAIEDKKTVLLHEAKARDLQTKIGAITNIEKATPSMRTLLAPLYLISYNRTSVAAWNSYRPSKKRFTPSKWPRKNLPISKII